MGLKRFVKKITKPIAKVLDKVVPNEIKPFLPFAAAAAPLFFSGGLGGTTLAQQMLRRGALFGGLNLGAQLAQEGSEGDFSGISTLLAAGSGALTAPGGLVTVPGADAGLTQTITQTPAEFFKTAAAGETGLKKFGLQALQKTAGGLQSAGETLRDPFSASLGEVGKAAMIPGSQGAIDLGMATARKALKDYEKDLADYERETGMAQIADDNARRTAIISAMTAGNHSEDVISETLALLGLKDGGRVGLREGGVLAQILPGSSLSTFQPFLGRPAFAPTLQQAQAVFPRLNQLEQGVDRAEEDLKSIRDRLGNELRQAVGLQSQVGLQQIPATNMLSISEIQSSLRGGGDLQGMKDGGIMNLGGKEMDLRGGGFVPIGKKERADDVPARLSKNEFVMTADAVRGAGGGNINEGARRMYETMNKLEARA